MPRRGVGGRGRQAAAGNGEPRASGFERENCCNLGRVESDERPRDHAGRRFSSSYAVDVGAGVKRKSGGHL